jgi:hypothetical protein
VVAQVAVVVPELQLVAVVVQLAFQLQILVAVVVALQQAELVKLEQLELS